MNMLKFSVAPLETIKFKFWAATVLEVVLTQLFGHRVYSAIFKRVLLHETIFFHSSYNYFFHVNKQIQRLWGEKCPPLPPFVRFIAPLCGGKRGRVEQVETQLPLDVFVWHIIHTTLFEAYPDLKFLMKPSVYPNEDHISHTGKLIVWL